MAQRFMGKLPKRQIVRPQINSTIVRKMSDYAEVIKVESVPEMIGERIENKTDVAEIKAMNNFSLDKAENILGNGDKAPKKRVKLEKKEKGLYEREEKSVTLITEDNKMLLND